MKKSTNSTATKNLKGQPLTKSQSKVAGMAARGLSNKEIADKMDLTVHTVKFHLVQVFKKLDIDRRFSLYKMKSI